jgi:hypothetical protein
MISSLEKALKRVERWPESAQVELADILAEIETGLNGEYYATPEELEAIDEADASGVATKEEVEAAFRAWRS